MRLWIVAAIALASPIALPAPASAACTCQCVNGQMTPICSSSIDLPPICPARLCPLTPPKVAPITPLKLPPLGTTACRMEQVYNDDAGEYQWERICR